MYASVVQAVVILPVIQLDKSICLGNLFCTDSSLDLTLEQGDVRDLACSQQHCLWDYIAATCTM